MKRFARAGKSSKTRSKPAHSPLQSLSLVVVAREDRSALYEIPAKGQQQQYGASWLSLVTRYYRNSRWFYALCDATNMHARSLSLSLREFTGDPAATGQNIRDRGLMDARLTPPRGCWIKRPGRRVREFRKKRDERNEEKKTKKNCAIR